MKKKLSIIIILIISGLVILKFVSKPFVNNDSTLGRISNLLNNNNIIYINCEGITKEEVRITWSSDTGKSKIVFRSGNNVGRIGHEYGNNSFTIYLNNKLEFRVNHFKTNNWHSHKYKFKIVKDNQKYKIKFIADGPNFVEFEDNYNLEGKLIN